MGLLIWLIYWLLFLTLLNFIYTTFNIAPPLDIWFEHDPLTAYTFDDSGIEQAKAAENFKKAVSIRHMKYVDQATYVSSIKALLMGPPVVAKPNAG